MNAKENYDKASECDQLGNENEAAAFYEAALPGIDTLSTEDQKGLLLGLGSTYRWISRLQDSARIFAEAQKRFPDAPEFPVFLSLTQLDQGFPKKAIATLIEAILKESNSPSLQQYKRALLDQIQTLRS